MGNETSIIRRECKPELTKSKTYISALAHQPKADHTDQRSALFGSETKPKKKSDSRKCSTAKTLFTDTEKKVGEKIAKSNSSKDSYISKLTESSLEDSSTIIVIERLAKNCKLIAPSHLQNVEFARASAKNWKKRSPLGERSSSSDQLKTNKSAQSILSDFLHLRNDEHELIDLCQHCRSRDFFSIGDSPNIPKYPSFVESSGSGRKSTATTLSDFSGLGRPLNIPLPYPDAHFVADSVAISWPQGASREDAAKQFNCLTCTKHTVSERGLTQPEYKQQAQRVNFTSKLFCSPALLGVLPVNKQIFDRRKPKAS